MITQYKNLAMQNAELQQQVQDLRHQLSVAQRKLHLRTEARALNYSRQQVLEALQRTFGVRSLAAADLDITEDALRKAVSRLGITYPPLFRKRQINGKEWYCLKNRFSHD